MTAPAPLSGDERERLRWRKRPVVVEAMQFTGDNADGLRAWSGGAFGIDIHGQPWVHVPGAWPVGVRVGEWIIHDDAGYYPCRSDIFAATYEPADAPDESATLRALVVKSREALGSVGAWEWMALKYAEAGGSSGPEMREWDDAKEVIDRTLAEIEAAVGAGEGAVAAGHRAGEMSAAVKGAGPGERSAAGGDPPQAPSAPEADATLRARMVRLEQALRDAIQSFHQKAHPGEPARKAMVSERTIDRWRAALADTGATEGAGEGKE